MFKTVAVVGASGAVGRIILELLEEREFPAETFRFLSSARSSGTELVFNNQDYVFEELTKDSFKGVDLVIASTPDETAAEFLPYAVE
ncbi:MAG TPA: aspartate-semialdehyde dehydrogenase, partial [Planctomycetaceae bacterium]|nr:aspartate-semialdehyde dehydrogenase [Planctomycetaceae bacterium]